MSTPPIRISCVRYLNTAPLVEGLEKLADVALAPAVPSRIAGEVIGGDADVGLVSIIDAARAAEELALLPVGMIGCDGPTLTVRIFSRVPLGRVTRLHADTDSHTSVVLARVLLKRLFGRDVQLAAFDARERVERGSSADSRAGEIGDDLSWPETVLLIGDKVVVDHPPESTYPHQLDLGEAWRQWTGLPFVYAMWMCKASALSDAAPRERIELAASILNRQRLHNATRLDWIVSARAKEARWPVDVARRYLGELLRYEVGPREREGVERFCREAADVGLASRRSLTWWDTDLMGRASRPSSFC